MSETREAGDLPQAVLDAIAAYDDALHDGTPHRIAAVDEELTSQIAAAIAAARAGGVALGAANMRETCRLSVVISAGEAWSRDAVEALDIARQRITTLSLPADADAILRAERAKGAEAIRAAVKEFLVSRKQWLEIEHGKADPLIQRLANLIFHIDALEILP